MGSRGHGTYAKLFEDVWYHPKTLALAKAFGERLKVPERWARQEVVHQLHLVLCWCLRESDSGEIGHLTPEMFARVVDWDDRKTSAILHEMWISSGFFDKSGGSVRVHNWDMNMTEALRKRRQRSGQCPDGGRTESAESGDPMSGQRPDNVRTTSAPSPDNVATSRARSETEDGRRKRKTEVEHSPTPLPEPDPPSSPGPSTVAASAASESPPKPPPVEVVELRSEPPGALRLVDLWREICPNLPQPHRPLTPDIAKGLQAAWKRVPDVAVWRTRFTALMRSDWHSGRSGKWRATLKWATGPENSAKLDAMVGGEDMPSSSEGGEDLVSWGLEIERRHATSVVGEDDREKPF